MGTDTKLDFTSLLDELIAASAAAETADAATIASPSLHIDMLEQIERLQAENIGLFADRAAREYGENTAPSRPVTEATPDLQPALDDLFFLDPQTISRELGIKSPVLTGQTRDRTERVDVFQRGEVRLLIPLRASSCYQLPVFSIDSHGSAGSRAGPFCSSSIEMPSGERTNAMWPSRGGRLIVTPAAIRAWQVAWMSSTS